MPSRYFENLQINRTSTGVRYYRTTLTSVIPLDNFKFTIIAQDGDRFDSLAARYYNDATKWWIIAKANDLLNGTLFIEGGREIYIPSVGLQA